MIAPIAVSLGEPAGIGPEIIAKSWSVLEGRLPFFVIGSPAHLTGLGAPVEPIARPADAADIITHALPVLPQDFPGAVTPGTPNPAQAQAIIDGITLGVDLAIRGEAAALCTAPIHKKALKDGAGFPYPGHTEFLAHLAGVPRVVMMLTSDILSVVPATTHIPLVDVPAALTHDLLMDTIRITDAGLRQDFGIDRPRIAVAGLNPHAGEGGVMGMEDQDLIAPIIAALAAEGLAVTGPHSADTLFHAEARAHYDVAIAMYHDQALIPIKTLAFERGVNVTLGLPFIRTSPDHGTALDIVGQDKADPTSMIEALKLAEQMARARAVG